MTLKCNFWRGGRVQAKTPSVRGRGVWMFSGTTHCKHCKTTFYNTLSSKV